MALIRSGGWGPWLGGWGGSCRATLTCGLTPTRAVSFSLLPGYIKGRRRIFERLVVGLPRFSLFERSARPAPLRATLWPDSTVQLAEPRLPPAGLRRANGEGPEGHGMT